MAARVVRKEHVMKKIALFLFVSLFWGLFSILSVTPLFSNDDPFFSALHKSINEYQSNIDKLKEENIELEEKIRDFRARSKSERLDNEGKNFLLEKAEEAEAKINANKNEIEALSKKIREKLEEIKKLSEHGQRILEHAKQLSERNFHLALMRRYASMPQLAIKTNLSPKLSLSQKFDEDQKLLEELKESMRLLPDRSRPGKQSDNNFEAKLNAVKHRLQSIDDEAKKERAAISFPMTGGLVGAVVPAKKESSYYENEKEILKLRKEALEAAVESANPDLNVEYDTDLSDQILRAKEAAQLTLERRQGDILKKEEIKELAGTALAELTGKPSPSKMETVLSCVADTGATLGGGLKFAFWDIPAAGFEKAGGGLSALADGIIKLDDVATRYGGSAKLGLFSIFSTLAQYQYTQRGSKNSQTQIFRAMAMVLGQDMGVKGQLPRGLEGLTDPLKSFKRQPISLQQRLDSQEKILDSVLTIGGDPTRPGSFPSGTHEQFQRILKGSVFPGGVPDFSFPPGFPGVYDPNLVNFSRQAFNGFPPFPTTKTRGALLNPNFASDNPFSRGSGAASNNFKTVSQSEGVRAVANLTAATAVVKEGAQDFSAQLENINPQDNSLKSLIDDIPGREARGIAIQARKNGLSSLLTRPGEGRLLDLQREQATLIIQKQGEIASRNKELFEATLEFRKQDFYVQPDEDGLLPAGGRDFSKRFARRTEALIRIQELTRQRAAAIEALALIRNNFFLFKRFQEGGKPGPFFQPSPSFGLLRYFLIRPLWAETKKAVPVPKWVSNWRQIAQKELQKADREIEDNRQKLATDLSHLRLLVALDPDGVHEINAEVVQMEKFNMKALAWQAKDNLGKLEKAESDLKINTRLTAEQKEKIRSDLAAYRQEFLKLEGIASEGANQFARLERLQREKMERSDLFDYYQELGEKVIAKYAQ